MWCHRWFIRIVCSSIIHKFLKSNIQVPSSLSYIDLLQLEQLILHCKTSSLSLRFPNKFFRILLFLRISCRLCFLYTFLNLWLSVLQNVDLICFRLCCLRSLYTISFSYPPSGAIFKILLNSMSNLSLVKVHSIGGWLKNETQKAYN